MHLTSILVALSFGLAVSASPRPQTLPPISDVKPQACISASEAIPTCGRQCLEQAATSVGCGVVDFTCSCSKQSAVASAATSCVIKACSGISQAEAVQSATEAVCSCVNQQPASGGSSSSSSSTAVATSAHATPVQQTTPTTSAAAPAQQQAAPEQQQQQQQTTPQGSGTSTGGSSNGDTGQQQPAAQQQPNNQQESSSEKSDGGSSGGSLMGGGALKSLFGDALSDLFG